LIIALGVLAVVLIGGGIAFALTRPKTETVTPVAPTTAPSTAAPETSAPKKTTTTEEETTTTKKKPPATSRLTTTVPPTTERTTTAPPTTTGSGISLTPAQREQLITSVMADPSAGLSRDQAACYVDALLASFTAAEFEEYNKTKTFTTEQQTRIIQIITTCKAAG